MKPIYIFKSHIFLKIQLERNFDEVLKEFNQIKEEREEKEIRKQARAKRKRLPR